MQTLFLIKSVPTLTSLPVTSPTLTVKKIHEIFGRREILQFSSGESKDLKYLRSPQTLHAP